MTIYTEYDLIKVDLKIGHLNKNCLTFRTNCPMQNLTLTIEEAARLLKVSTKTLRRWDTKGVLVPLRTTGSHRRYTTEQIVEFKTKIKNERKAKRERYESQPVSVFVAPQIPTPTPSIPSEPVVPFIPQVPVIPQRQPIHVDTIPTFQQNNPPSSSSPPTESRNIPYKAWGLLGVSFFLILSLGFLSTLHFNSGDGKSSTASNVSPEQTVLGASKGSRYGFRIGIPTLFTQNAEVLKDLTVKGVSYLTGGIDTKGADIDAGEGKVTASNIVYSVEGSRGISVSGDQELTIINTDRGSSQKIFNTIKSGSASITAVTNTDAFEFVAGDNISLSLDTTNKKLTITGEEASSDTPTAQGWAFDTDVIYLEDSSYSVGIGTDSPSTKLHVVGNILGSGDITAGGNLNATGSIQTGGVSRITSTGADPREKTAILKGWADIQAFADQGGVMTSSGILIPQGTKDSISVRKGTKVFEIGTDFAGSLGFVRTVGKSVNLFSEGYPVYEIKRGFGKFMQAEYRECGIENTYSVDPDAIAQQTLLNLALTRGKGDVTRPTSHL